MLLRLAILGLLLSTGGAAHAQRTVREDFEASEPCLRDPASDATYQVQVHRRASQGAHAGRGCEQLAIRGNNGTYVYFSYPIPPARVIAELHPSVWLKADRPGLAILARVVLPRSIDERTGKPITTLLRGSDYQRVGNWQQLSLTGLPATLERQVRMLRTRFGPNVDAREAYVDRILLNLYGGPGTTNVLVDDLEIDGVVSTDSRPAADASPILQVQNVQSLPAASSGGQGIPSVEFKAPLLMVGGRPFFVRAVEYRGEPLSRLKDLGFNTVKFTEPASATLLREAAAAGIWAIAPPPTADQLEPRGPQAIAPQIGRDYDAVLAWDLGSGLTQANLKETRRWARLVHASDPRERPVMCDAAADLFRYTQDVKILLARREPLGTSLSLGQFAEWLRERTQLALPGTPLWVTVQTEPPPALLEQARLLASQSGADPKLQIAQIRNLTRIALAAGARGLCFASNSRLDANDPAARLRATTLELLNLELELIALWPAAGAFSASSASSDPHLTGAVMASDLSRLLLPIFSPPGGQLTLGNPAASPMTITVMGVPEGNDAYELTLTSLRRLPSNRVTGGTNVVLRDIERDSMVVFTQDPLVIQTMSQRLEKSRRRAVELASAVAAGEFARVNATAGRLTSVGHALKGQAEATKSVQEDLRNAESLATSNLDKAYDHARHAVQSLRTIEREHWNAAQAVGQWPLANPLAANFGTLPESYLLTAELAVAPRGANLCAEGDFEDQAVIARAGWRPFYYQQQRQQQDVVTLFELSPRAAHAGKAGLRLQAAARDPKNKPAVVETAPLWVTSAPLAVNAGDLVQIQFWLQVPQAIEGSVDGLLVVDSLGGEALAERITSCEEWRQVTLYRAAPRSGPMSVTFALTGLGEACIDDFSVQIVSRAPPMPPRPPQRGAATGVISSRP